MNINRFAITLLVFLIGSLPVFGQSIQEKINTNENWNNNNNNVNNNGLFIDNGGGYNNNTQVLGTRQLFQDRRFIAQDFQAWLSIFHYADAFVVFDQLVKEGYIYEDGEVIRPVPIVGVRTRVGDILKIKVLKKAVAPRFTAMNLIDALKSAEVLDQDGYVVGIKAQNVMRIEDADFSLLDQNLQSLNLPIQNESVARGLKRELYKFITAKHQVNEVTQLETTRYQSRADNLLEQIGEQIVGSLVGKWLYPDRQKVSTFEGEWVNTFTLASYYPQYQTRLNRAPYHRRGSGWTLLNGYTHIHSLRGDVLDADDANAYTAVYKGYFAGAPGALDSASVGLINYGLSVDVIESNTDSPQTSYYSPFIGVGGLGGPIEFDFNLGLSYQTGSTVDDALGFRFGLRAAFYPVNPLSFEFEFTQQSQPSFLDSQTEWELNRTSLGVGLHYSQVSLNTGYRWYYAGNDLRLFQGWFFGGTLYL